VNELINLRAEAARLAAELGPGLDGLGEDEALRASIAGLAEAGLLGWTVPAAHGGAATELCGAETVSVRALCAVREELAYENGVLDLAFIMQGLGSFPIALSGNETLAAEVLPAVAKGECVAAFAVTEEGAGSSLGEVVTSAVRDGDGWKLDGRKTYISNAGVADRYTVLARTGEDETTMFSVPAAEVSIVRFEVMAPHPIGDVVMEGAVVPDSARLGEVGTGLELALANLQRFRTCVAAAACGFARRALDESIGHLSRREQFGRKLSKFQGLRFDVAEMDARLRAAQLLVEEAAGLLDAGGDATAEVARAKLIATETAGWICDRAVQHHGGSGVRRGSVVERLYREVRALRIYEGTSEVQKLILAKELFDKEA
jgi:acyl-CoA dehydrogenase